jgi:hypothetical protein
MKIQKKFNQLTKSEYIFYLKNHKKYTNFNTLGLYRSIIENEKLSIEEKIEVKEFSNQYFKKFFTFLQVKDPQTYIKLTTLGQKLTVADENQLFENLINNVQKILQKKRIKHRNFGVYSRHSCGYELCPCNGIMVKQNTRLVEREMWFNTDKNSYSIKQKAKSRRKDRKKIRVELRKESYQ